MALACFVQAEQFSSKKVDLSLSTFLMESNFLENRNSALCFNEYLPQLSAVGETFQVDYKICEDILNDSLNYIETDYAGKRSDINAQSSNICNAQLECNQKAGMLDFFECTAEMVNFKNIFYSIRLF